MRTTYSLTHTHSAMGSKEMSKLMKVANMSLENTNHLQVQHNRECRTEPGEPDNRSGGSHIFVLVYAIADPVQGLSG